MEPKYLNRKV